MIEKALEYLPYDFLGRLKFVHFFVAGAVVGGSIFAGYYFTLHQTVRDELVALQNQRTQTQQKLNSYKTLIAQKDAIAEGLVRSTGELAAMKRQLPREKELPGLLKEVAGFGDGREEFDVVRFQLEEGSVGDFYKEIPIAIQMRGSFWDTLDFLDKMQNRLQLVNFSDLTMDMQTSGSSGRSDDRSVPVLSTRLVASTYAYIDGAEDNVPAAANNAANK